jgi:small subunit ribosomal protein S2
MRELLEAGVHFGHQTRRWNPKMRRFIFGERGGIYIIDLQQTIQLLDEAHGYVRNVAERGGTVMFVGTKKQAQDSIEEHARRVGMPYVNHRWLGGLLTNFRTIQDRITALHELRRQRTEGQLQLLPPKERQTVLSELEKLETNLGGVADARRLPDAVVVVDLKKETLAVREARRLRIPVIGLVDTNCDPDDADFVIPGNDDAIRSTTLIVRVLADGIAQGRAKGMRVGDFAAADANGDAPATADEAAPEQVEALAEVAAAQGDAEAPAQAAAAAGEPVAPDPPAAAEDQAEALADPQAPTKAVASPPAEAVPTEDDGSAAAAPEAATGEEEGS